MYRFQLSSGYSFRFGASICLSVALFLNSNPSVQAADPQVLHGRVPPPISNMQPLGRLPATNQMHLAIALPWRNQATLTQLLEDIYNPASPKYHQYLSTEQF